VNFGSRAVTGAALLSGMYAATDWMLTNRMVHAVAPGEAQWGLGIGRRGSVGQSELGAAAWRKAVWWDLRLASLLTHLFYFLKSTTCFIFATATCI